MAARAWLGTPYRHQASVKGVGADCLGLVRGLWREVAGAERAQHERELEGGRAGLKQAAAQLAKLRKGAPGLVADAAAQLASGATVAAAEADRRLGREIQVRAG